MLCIVIKNEKDVRTDEKHKEGASVMKYVEDEDGYWDYIKLHGNHFTEKLSKYASEMMQNRNGLGHRWSMEDVTTAFSRMGYAKPSKANWADVTYACNMAYADYYGSSLQSESEVLRQGYDDAADPDGYEGKIFNRWVSDMVGKGIKIHWEEFI